MCAGTQAGVIYVTGSVAYVIDMHVLPGWIAGEDFLSVVSETRVLPETLDVARRRMRKAFAKCFVGAAISLSS